MTKMGPIAKQISDRITVLADPTTKWVNRAPANLGESCLVLDCREATIDGWQVDGFEFFTSDAMTWLDEFVEGATSADFEDGIGFEAIEFNDWPDRSQEEVLWMLEDALEEAILEGV